MKNYDNYLSLLPLKGGLNRDEIRNHPLFLGFNNYSDWDIVYFKIEDNDACAVVLSDKDTINEEILGPDKAYTVRLVYVLYYNNHYKPIKIPDTVWSIYGSQKLNEFSSSKPFEFENNPYFEYKNGWLYSKDGKDLIYGEWTTNFDSYLIGVETIHNIYNKLNSYESNICTLRIPTSVKKIFRIDGDFSDVIFDGLLPEFADDAFKNAKFDMVKIMKTMKECSTQSINTLMKVVCFDDKTWTYYLRPESKTLFAAHALTTTFPKSKGYIALTNAKFECDGETILINTPWIATICPQTFNRSDGMINGSIILVGLKEHTQEQGGVYYEVYESPDAIDEKIAKV